MPVLLLTVENPDQLLDPAMLGTGALIRVERSATGGGAGYAEIGTKALVAATRSYTFYDLAGAVDSWYRVRYSKSDGSSPSSYGDEFQTGDETGGLLCSVEDVEQDLGQTLTANEREMVVDKIRQVTTAIEGYCGRWFVPRPLAGTTTYRTHTRGGRVLRIPKGIREVVSLSVAIDDQPASGGTYSPVTDHYIDPPEIERDVGWPGTSIRLIRSVFQHAAYGVEIVGAFGWARVPDDIQGVAVRAVTRRHLAKGGGGPVIAVGPSGTEFVLPDMSGADRAVLTFYRHIAV